MTQHLTQAGALALAAALIGASAFPAAAQVRTQACESQQSMEQLLETDGGMVPDDCRPVTITRFERETGDVCAIDLSGDAGGVVDELLAVARTDQWWIDCDSLGDVGEERTP